VIESEILITKL